MGNLFNRQTLPPQDLHARRLPRFKIAFVAAFVALAVSGVGTLATEKSDLALRDNPAAIAPEERDRFSLDIEYREQNWDGFARVTAVVPSQRQQTIDDIEFYEQNWHLNSENAFERRPAAAGALVAKRDDIEFREQNWHFDSGNAFERQPAAATVPSTTRDDIEFNEQNWNLKTGEVLDLGTPSALSRDN